MGAASLGNQELALLRWVIEHQPVSVGEAASGFGTPRGLARSTVLTMMERLRAKRHLRRERRDTVFVYSALQPQDRVLRGLVRSFVEGKLAGSVSPFVHYLVDRAEVTDAELAQLEELVARLQSKRAPRREPNP
jgi:predicted transcriptional regulator